MPSVGDLTTDERQTALLTQVQAFCSSSRFEASFQKFVASKLDIFEELFERDDTCEGYNHDHRCMEAYQEYIDEFEGRIEDFIESQGYTLVEFKRICEEGMSKSKEIQMFVEALIAVSDYFEFFNLMMRHIRFLKRQQMYRFN